MAATAVFAYFGVRYPNRYQAIVEREASRYNLDASLLRGIIWTESKFRPKAESNRGAKGLMQLMPQTAAFCAQNLQIPLQPDSLTDPEINIRLGAYYFRYLLDKFDETQAIAAYNAGDGNVARWLEEGYTPDTFPYKETRDYIKRVYHAKKIYAFRVR